MSRRGTDKGLPAWLLVWGVNSGALFAASWIFRGVSYESASAVILTALILCLASYVLEPILYLLTLPINVATLGLFSIVVNGIVLLIVEKLVPGFAFSGKFLGLGWAMLTAALISVWRLALRGVMGW